MIEKEKLKFNKDDLAFFDKQRDVKEIKLNDLHYFIITHIKHGKHISGAKLAELAKVSIVDIREHILQIRRYKEVESHFITANKNGYTKSCFNKCCENDLIDYFNKTQTRFKETFNELCNLMKAINFLNENK